MVEQARIDVLGYQAENKSGDLDKTQLKTVLDKYFDEVPDLTVMEKDVILNTELHTLARYGTHTIVVIYELGLYLASKILIKDIEKINQKLKE